MKYFPFICFFTLFFIFSAISQNNADTDKVEFELVNSVKIWDASHHNGFPALINFRGDLYCAFREGSRHVGDEGAIRLIRSSDAENWTTVEKFAFDKMDMREGRFSITPSGNLMLHLSLSKYDENGNLEYYQTMVTQTTNGEKWMNPKVIENTDHWLWETAWCGRRSYVVGYNTQESILFSSRNGKKYDPIARFDFPGWENEASIEFDDNNNMYLLFRRSRPKQNAILAKSPKPYENWKWIELDHFLGGPELLLVDTLLIAGGRVYPGRNFTNCNARTAIGLIKENRFDPLIILPSGGDTGYPSIIHNDGYLWIAYYSSHEAGNCFHCVRELNCQSAIYLAKARINTRN